MKKVIRLFIFVVLISIFVGGGYWLFMKKGNNTFVDTRKVYNQADNNKEAISGICRDCNVILVTLDTLRADHLSSYGYSRDTSKNIDELAKRGVLFENNFVQMPYTPTSHWSILSGTYPHTHKHYSPGVINNKKTLKNNTTNLITKVLTKNKYTNLAVMGSKMVVNLAPEFDKAVLIKTERIKHTSKKVTDKALELIKSNKNNNFFMWIHYWDPHQPYLPPSEYIYQDNKKVFPDGYVYSRDYVNNDSQSNNFGKVEYLKNYNISLKMQQAYDGEIKHTDEEFGRVLNLLQELNLDKKTIIVITSDHGELFGEHKDGNFNLQKFNKPVFEHYETLYDEEIRTPLIIYNPKSNFKNKKIDSLVQEIDIAPTILGMLGIDIPNNIEGKNLQPIINGQIKKVNDYIFSILKFVRDEASMGGKWKERNLRKLRATLRTEKWKLIRFENIKNNQTEIIYVLYDLANGENENVLEENEKIADDMIKQLESMIAEDKSISDDISLSKEELDVLRSLGYLK